MADNTSTYKANPNMIKMWSERTKCWMCRHRFTEPVVLPVKQPQRGKFQPNISAEVLFHMSDTHGLPPETVRQWIIGSVYSMELSLFGIKGMEAE